MRTILLHLKRMLKLINTFLPPSFLKEDMEYLFLEKVSIKRHKDNI